MTAWAWILYYSRSFSCILPALSACLSCPRLNQMMVYITGTSEVLVLASLHHTEVNTCKHTSLASRPCCCVMSAGSDERRNLSYCWNMEPKSEWPDVCHSGSLRLFVVRHTSNTVWVFSCIKHNTTILSSVVAVRFPQISSYLASLA